MTIRQVCARYGLTPDTLRYYEKLGVIPPVHRTAGGVRDYDAEDLGWVENAVCMRSAGVPVERIAEYVRLYRAGDSTIAARRDLLVGVREGLLERCRQLDGEIDRLSFKIGRYDAAVQTGVLRWDADGDADATTVPCTACHYCVSHCPQQLPIPDLLHLYNEAMAAGSGVFISSMGLSALPAEQQPSACVACHSCEQVCPQQIHIPDALADFARRMGQQNEQK